MKVCNDYIFLVDYFIKAQKFSHFVLRNVFPLNLILPDINIPF